MAPTLDVLVLLPFVLHMILLIWFSSKVREARLRLCVQCSSISGKIQHLNAFYTVL